MKLNINMSFNKAQTNAKVEILQVLRKSLFHHINLAVLNLQDFEYANQ